MDQAILQLSPSEKTLVDAIIASQPVPAAANALLPVRASVLRSLILGLPVQIQSADKPSSIPLPGSGLKLRYLHVTDDSGDLTKPCGDTGILRLEDACASDGSTLPPLELEYCLFPRPIHISRARFRRFSLKGSWLVHLCAAGIRIEGPLNISNVRSAEDHPQFIPPDPRTPKTGAELPPPAKQEGQPAPTQESPEKPKDIAQSADLPIGPPQVAVTPAIPAGIPQGHCWVQLHNSTIGDDIDASGSIFASPQPRKEYVNSTNAIFAFDLSGSTVRGRFKFGPGCVAVGGIDISRSEFTGSVWGSGASLTAIEGSAFDAQNALIQGNLVLDYSREASVWTPFRGFGFINLTNAHIGASLLMRSAQLLQDVYQRGGLWAARVDISGSCDLCGSECDNPEFGPFVPFRTTAGITLADATIGSNLDLRGAVLSGVSKNAIFAPGLVVSGDADFSIYSATTTKGMHSYAFQATGSINLYGATFKRDLYMYGAQLMPPVDQPDSYSLVMDGATVKGSVHYTCIWGMVEGQLAVFQPRCKGRFSMRGITIGDTLDMSGAWLGPFAFDFSCLDLSGAHVGGDVLLEGFVDNSATSLNILRFTLEGSLALDSAKIGKRLSLRGASVRAQNNSTQMHAIYAINIQVDAPVSFEPYFARDKGETIKQIFECFGCINIVASNLLVGLFFVEAALEADRSSNGNGTALIAMHASIRLLHMQSCTVTGNIVMRDCNISYGMSADYMMLTSGVLDLWEASLGYLSLSRLALQSCTPASVILNLERARIPGLLTVGIRVIKTAPLPDAAVPSDLPAPKEPLVLRVDLRNLVLGELFDEDGKGWSDEVRIFLEGFTYSRMPHRTTNLTDSPHRGWSGYVFDAALKLERPASALHLEKLSSYLIDPLWELHKYFHMADAHIDWLNRQYWYTDHPQLAEFTPGSYDQLARVLREEGHDTEAKRILSAKFSVKRQVDVFAPARPFWAVYHRFFDYGLSAFNAFLTFGLCLALGTFGVWCANHSVAWLHHQPVLVVSTSAVSTVALADDPSKPDFDQVRVQTATSNTYPEEIPCGIHRIDSFLYAVESFVPALDLGQTKLCEISAAPKYWPWRWGRAMYAILGWIVTSITVLTVPGILRSRAEG